MKYKKAEVNVEIFSDQEIFMIASGDTQGAIAAAMAKYHLDQYNCTEVYYVAAEGRLYCNDVYYHHTGSGVYHHDAHQTWLVG